MGIQIYFKGGITTENLWVAPKDKNTITQKSGVFYRYKCYCMKCDEEYTGESAWTFQERLREHLRAPFPIYDHANIRGHQNNLDNFTTVGRESHNLTRTIKEAST